MTFFPFFCFRLSSSLGTEDDELHIKVYDDDRGAIGSTKIKLEKIRQAGGYLDEWVKLPAHLGLRSHGEIRLILSLS